MDMNLYGLDYLPLNLHFFALLASNLHVRHRTTQDTSHRMRPLLSALRHWFRLDHAETRRLSKVRQLEVHFNCQLSKS